MQAAPSASHRRGTVARLPSPPLVLGAIVSVQSGAALAATLFSQIGPLDTVFLRLASAAAMLLALRRPRLRSLRGAGGRTRRELAHPEGHRLAVLFGLVLAAMNVSFYEAIARIPLGIAVSLEFVGPLAVSLMGSRRRANLLWSALALAGVLALTRGGTRPLDALGVVLALVAGGFWGCYILINARVGAVYEGVSGLTLALCVAALALVVPVALDAGANLLNGEVLALGVAVGALSSVIPYSLEIEALRRIAPAVFGVLMSLEPAAAALSGLVVLGQQLQARELLGIALVALASAGAAGVSVRRRQPDPL